MQVYPGLDVLTIAETRFSLRLCELVTSVISPGALPEKRIPNRNFFVAGAPATSEAPFEDFFI
jgi:hypothetical protein